MISADYFLFGLAFVVSPLHASATGHDVSGGISVKRIASPALVDVLSSLEIMLETQTKSGLVVRVFRTTQGGECDPGREASTCPRNRLIVVAGENDEGMRSAVARQTSSLIGWETNSERFKDADRTNNSSRDAVTFEAAVCQAPNDVESGKIPAVGGLHASRATWWRKVRYKFTVGLGNISTRQLGAPGAYCDLY